MDAIRSALEAWQRRPDPDTLTCVLRAVEAWLKAQLSRSAPGLHDADRDDLVDCALVGAWRSLPYLCCSDDPAKYMSGVLRNRFRSWLAQAASTTPTATEHSLQELPARVSEEENRIHWSETLEGLSEQHQRVLTMIYRGGHDHQGDRSEGRA